MVGYQAGDHACALAFIRQVSPWLLRLFNARADSRAHADDLLQETWLRIHRVRHTYRPSEPVLPWVYAIARYVRIDYYRRNRRKMAHEEAWSDLSDAVAHESEPSPFEALDLLLAPLKPAEREVIEMLKVAGMSLEEVARANSCSVGSVKQTVHRAYEKLRKRARDARGLDA